MSKVFFSIVGKPIEKSVSLRDFSNFNIGGLADFFFTAISEKDLITSVGFARTHDIPFFLIGGGYNLLFDDDGFRGIIIRNCIRGIRSKGTVVEAESGTPLFELIQYCLLNGLGGLEFLAGIPGTIGGAVYGNAGAVNQEIGQVLQEARILTESGKIISVEREYYDLHTVNF